MSVAKLLADILCIYFKVIKPLQYVTSCPQDDDCGWLSSYIFVYSSSRIESLLDIRLRKYSTTYPQDDGCGLLSYIYVFF